MGEMEAEAEGGVAFEVEGGHADAVALHGGDFLQIGGREVGGPGGEDLGLEGVHPGGGLFVPGGAVGGDFGGGGGGDEGVVDGGVELVWGEVFAEDAEVGWGECFGGGHAGGVHEVGALEVAVEPVLGADVEGLGVFVGALGDVEADLVFFAKEFVEAAGALVEADDAVEGEDAVVVGVADEEGSGCDQGGEAVVVPAVCVDLEHAVAVAFDAAVDEVVAEVGDAGGGGGAGDAVVEGGDPPGVGAAAGAAGDAEAFGVDFGAGFEVVEGADAVPGFDAGGGVAAGEPPPFTEVMGAVVFAFDFAELEGVDGEAGVAVAGEPEAVVVVGGFVAEADALFLHDAVAAEVEDGGEGFFGGGFGFVEVGGDVEAGAGLEVEAFDEDVGGVEGAGDGGL